MTSEALEAHFKKARLADLLKGHFDTLRGGVKVMLNSFFIQPRGGGSSQGNCVFTHKSFREYLTARRLVRELGRFHRLLGDVNPAKLLDDWFTLAGPSAVDR